jgi:hypothetical protein
MRDAVRLHPWNPKALMSPNDIELRPPLTPDVCEEHRKPALGDLLRLAERFVLAHNFVNQSLHILNVIVRPKLGWQLAKGFNREGQGFDDDVSVAAGHFCSLRHGRPLDAALGD